MGEQVNVKRLPMCDFPCKGVNVAHPAQYDGATMMGPWGYMCETAFRKYGLGLGTGRGQRLVVKTK